MPERFLLCEECDESTLEKRAPGLDIYGSM